MEHGDISNGLISRLIYVVWEGMIGVPCPKFPSRAARLRSVFTTGRRAMAMYDTNDLCVNQLWELWGLNQGIAIVTYLEPRYAEALHERINSEGIPHCRFIITTVQDMAHRIATEPDCLYLVDGDPSRQLTYGPKGRYIHPADAQLIGRVA